MEPAPPPFHRVVAHLDMDTFYVSVERLLDPSLEGLPVAVGGSPAGRGVIASASYEARAYGVRSAMPTAEALRLCPKLILVGRGFSEYAEYSRRIHEALLHFTPQVQMASQDEAYLDLTGTERLWGVPATAAERLRRTITAETGLPCSVGIGSNKLVAKVGSGMAKPAGVRVVERGGEAAFLATLPVRKIPGVGPKSVAVLEAHGIRTCGELAALDAEGARALFGDHGSELVARARGESDAPVVVEAPPKSLSHEETFPQDTRDAEFLDGILSNLCEKVANRLRRHGARAALVTLKYRYQGFETHTAARSLADPTDDEVELLRAARTLLAENWNRGRAVRLLGVAAGNLVFGRAQLDLFAAAEDERKLRLHAAIDAIRGRHGYGAVRRASSAGRAEEKNENQWGGG
ncbi:MAG: DNA polymerase IV [Candidatus Sumerlaeia bacterium]|nr:DNA polymerase IV [Candidatus Sumerlaeia bacterium]